MAEPESPSPSPSSATLISATLISATIDLWVRYLVPLTILSAIALSPVLGIALLAKTPIDLGGADTERLLGWGFVALAWPCQLLLVGGAAAIARARPSRRGALRIGIRALGRAIVPSAAAIAAVCIGGLALALPGLALLGLTTLAGASEARGAAAVADSIETARRHLVAVALAAAALLVFDLGAVWIAKLALLEPLSKPLRPAQLAALPRCLQMIALVFVVGAPLPASALALIRVRDAR